GSFAQTCTDIEQRGPFLRALCEDRRGRLIPSRIDMRGCPSRRLANANGRLACEGGGRSRARSYEQGFGDYEEFSDPRQRGYDPRY
ncbi:CVNH domain-containing protein, partial [Escherichia coli]|uniref:CVNH domain-containing protein n=1 Tax=Escherichia coli TaxID=562 RepID=UPI000D67AEC4